MKKCFVICGALALLSANSAMAAVYEQTLDVYQYSVGGTIDYNHTYDGSADPILSATLTIVADDVDGPGDSMDGEQDAVWFQGHYLGLLNDMGFYTNWSYQPGPGNDNQPLTTTVFNLDPSWIDLSMPVQVQIEANWGVEIETSTLAIEQVPVPGAVLLGVLGLGTAGWRLRKRA